MLHAHSGLRFLILSMGVVCLVVFGLGLAQKKEFTKGARIAGAIFAGLTHLQVIIGLGLLAMGLYYPRLIGHIVMMLAAAIVAQFCFSKNRRATPPGYRLPLIGTVIALLLMVGGTFAIGRHPFQATVFRSAPTP